MVLTGFLYIDCTAALKYTKLRSFFSLLELELMPMQLSWIKCTQMFHILQDKYINQNFLYKTKFGSWGGNILNIYF